MERVQHDRGTKKTEERCSLYVMLFAFCLAFALPQHADSAMIYSGIKNIALPDQATLTVDLDGDGVTDFEFLSSNPHFINDTLRV